MSWSTLGDWWVGEVAGDPAYEAVVTPLLIKALQPGAGSLYLDLGAGDGRLMRALAGVGATVHGIDVNLDLAERASQWGQVVVADLPDLGFLRHEVYDGAYCVLVLEHLADHEALFAAVAEVVKPGGLMALVSNHPVWTAPGSTPISDADGEVLWRPGDYFGSGTTEEPAGTGTVTFHHRSMASLLNAASSSGWSLEWVDESPHHDLNDQGGIPRLLACRWRLLP
jgi:SAM-dependent methyltransferase